MELTEMNSLTDLLTFNLKVIYDAETQTTEILPLISERVTHPDLKKIAEDQLAAEKKLKKAIVAACDQLGENVTGQISEPMIGLNREIRFFLNEDFDDNTVDAALMNILQRVSHYFVACYGAMSNYADLLDLPDIKNDLGHNLKIKKKLDDDLKQLADHLNTIAIDN